MSNSEFKDALDRTSEIELTVRGRKSGQDISRPVWFVHENNTLYLLPVQGSETNWYEFAKRSHNENFYKSKLDIEKPNQ